MPAFATAYAAWLAHLSGQPWRLPSEEAWEKAARWDPRSGKGSGGRYIAASDLRG